MRPHTNQFPEHRQLGDFEILRELGRGGMGVVYEARQISLNRQVALKVLSSSMGLPPKAVQRFRREAEAAARLHHTNIVPVYATGEENGSHYYAMELVEGPSLDRVLHFLRQDNATEAPGDADAPAEELPDWVSQTIDYVPKQTTKSPTDSSTSSGLSSGNDYFDKIARLVADVADALEYAHRHAVIHRDIKPSNLLLAAEGKLSINDFGLARILEQPGVTMTGEFVGTPAYMSPEQITAGRIPIDHRTDIYSLGATLYELLTLQRPFTAHQRDELLAQIIQKEPRRPRRINKKIPVDLETICMKAMEKDPDRRYQSAGEMAEDLRRYVNRFAISARRAGPLTRLRKWVRRNPALSASLAAVLTCAGVAVWLAFQAHLAERARQEAQAKHEMELMDEKRAAALDKAILASRLEDFKGARAAIREAEKLGCSPGQINMLYGQLELYQGHTKEAIEHLEQAVDLLRDSAAAQAMLALAYFSDGQNTAGQRNLAEAVRLNAENTEDLLFLGHAESLLDSSRGLEKIDKAIDQRPNSPLARLVRAQALRRHIEDMPDLDRAKQAMQDVQVIRGLSSDSPTALILSIDVHTMCYHVFGELKETALHQEALSRGMEDERELQKFANHPRAIYARFVFLDDIGQGDRMLDELRRTAESTEDLYVMYYYAYAMYLRGQFEQAAKVWEKMKGEPVFNLYRIVALAELPDGVARATKLYRETAAGNLRDYNLFNCQLISRFLGHKEEAIKISREFLKRPEHFPPLRQKRFQHLLEYCAGERSADDLIASMEGKRVDLCNAHLCIALTALADGDRKTAQQHLEHAVKLRFFEVFPYDLSRMLLSRINRDPAWPPWIKAAK